MKIGGPLDWRPFRDVFEVDGKAVRDRDGRLMALFARPSATSDEQAARIAQESARYNIGLARRTINTPVLALLFLQPSIQSRFRFKLGKRDGGARSTTWTVDYREEARPTIVRGLLLGDDTDLRAEGRFWIDTETGRVSRAELRFTVVGMRTTLTTEFRRDDRLGLDVPAEMREEYRIEQRVTEMGPTDKAVGAPRVSHVTEQVFVAGNALYSNFRRFDVSAVSAIGESSP
jgi:hypothetical protein